MIDPTETKLITKEEYGRYMQISFMLGFSIAAILFFFVGTKYQSKEQQAKIKTEVKIKKVEVK